MSPAPVLVSVERASVALGTTTILDGVSLGVAAGDKIGIVGRNGAGKSTLVAVLTQDRALDSGRVSQRGGLRTGVLTQRDSLDPDATVLDAVVGADRAEHSWRGDAHIRGVLGGLEVDGLLERTVGTLSGGERRRVALAALLVEPLDLLVLDEPTNHLDVEGVAWLAGHLAGRDGTPRHQALLVITHDRWFLDEVVDVTWEVEAGQVHSYDGGYSAYALARAERSRQAAAGEARRQNLLRKELAWLRRGAPARTSKPRYRVEAANALIDGEPPPRDTAGLQRFAATRLGKSVYDAEDVSLSFGSRVLLADVTWRLGPGDRVGLIGVNGAGKSTLLRVLLGAQPLDAGVVRTGVTVVPAYLSQDVAEIEPGLRVLEAVTEIATVLSVGREDLTASQLLERFGFEAARQWTRVGELSGGERRRLQLLRLLMGGPNVLVLDEPTNDLDVDTLLALEDLLDGWAGTLVVVSHDRWFLERVTDSVVALVGDGSLAALPGGVSEYLALRSGRGKRPRTTATRTTATRTTATRATATQATASRAGGGGVAPAGSSAPAAAGPDSVAPAAVGGADERGARRELVAMERALEKLRRQESTLHDRLAAASDDYVQAAALDVELRALTAERAALEDSWLVLAERLES